MADNEIYLRAKFVCFGRIIAWECTRCRKLFSMTVEEALANTSALPPAIIVAEFNNHDCAVCLATSLTTKRELEQQLAVGVDSTDLGRR